MTGEVGHVYVLEFSDSTVKVGRSARIKSRIGQHDYAARRRGLTIVGCWESPLHVEWDINEETLKRAALMLGGTPIAGTCEHFTGLKWVKVVGAAGRLPYTPPSEVPPRSVADRRSGRISEREQDVRLYALGIQAREVGTEAEKDNWEQSGYTPVCSVRERPDVAA